MDLEKPKFHTSKLLTTWWDLSDHFTLVLMFTVSVASVGFQTTHDRLIDSRCWLLRPRKEWSSCAQVEWSKRCFRHLQSIFFLCSPDNDAWLKAARLRWQWMLQKDVLVFSVSFVYFPFHGCGIADQFLCLEDVYKECKDSGSLWTFAFGNHQRWYFNINRRRKRTEATKERAPQKNGNI